MIDTFNSIVDEIESTNFTSDDFVRICNRIDELNSMIIQNISNDKYVLIAGEDTPLGQRVMKKLLCNGYNVLYFDPDIINDDRVTSISCIYNFNENIYYGEQLGKIGNMYYENVIKAIMLGVIAIINNCKMFHQSTIYDGNDYTETKRTAEERLECLMSIGLKLHTIRVPTMISNDSDYIERVKTSIFSYRGDGYLVVTTTDYVANIFYNLINSVDDCDKFSIGGTIVSVRELNFMIDMILVRFCITFPFDNLFTFYFDDYHFKKMLSMYDLNGLIEYEMHYEGPSLSEVINLINS